MTPSGLGRRRGLAQLALLWESAWPRLWAPLAVVGLFLIVALLGLPQRLPGGWHVLLLLGFAAAIAALVARGFRGFAMPGPGLAERRLERDSSLRHRPLATLADQASGTDPDSLALWRAHQARAAAAIGTLRVAVPRPGLARRDPRALRAALLLGLGAALVMAGDMAPERLRRALRPAFAAPPAPAGLRLEAWATPPAYTGAAPQFLPAGGGAVSVPAGSRLQVALSGGGESVPELIGPGLAVPFRALERGSFAGETPLDADGAVAVRRGGRELVVWALTVRPDAPPTVAFAEPPGRAARGTGLRLPWRVEDDWGVASLVAELVLRARPEAPPVGLDLGLPGGGPRNARGTAQPDLTAHPWAGLEVQLRLRARDGAGQDGVSEPAVLTLPERSFNHPVAQRLVALRRALSVDPEARAPARVGLETLLAAPEAFEHDTTTYLALRVALARLSRDRRPTAVPEVQELLWDVALALEEGRDGRTQRALQQAREALREALEQAEQTPPATPEREAARTETDRRIQELRDAIRQHLEALTERLQRENAEAIPFDPAARMLDQRELERRTQRLRDAARQDRTEEARRELAELEEMLRALEEGRAQRAETPERQQRRERGQQQQGVVQDMVRRQGDMLDRSHQRAEQAERDRAQRGRQRSPFAPAVPPATAQPPNAAEAERERQADGRGQRALRRALGEVMQQFGDLTGEVPEALGRADQAMREAQESLSGGADARDAQARAMRALQEGGRQMAQSLQRQLGPAPPGGADGEGEGEPQDMAGEGPGGGEGDQPGAIGEGRDPLGRRTRDVNGSPDSGADTRVPDEAEQLRTRRIQEELRRRGAEKARPAEELDYIDRLLKRF